MSDPADMDGIEDIPLAVIERDRRRRFGHPVVWILPLLAILGSLAVSWSALKGRGPTIVIHADHGYGIHAGDPVRYLGIDVGSVSDVVLGSGSGSTAVRLEVQLVDLCRDPPDRLAVFVGDEELGFAVLEPRVLTWRHKVALLHQKRRCPVVVELVE